MPKTTPNRRLAPWLVPVLIIASMPVGLTDSPAPARDILLCVGAPAPLLEAMGIAVDDVYDSFVLAKASSADEGALRRAGIPFFQIEGLDDVVLPGASFVLSRDDYSGKGLDAFGPDGGRAGAVDGAGPILGGPMYVIVKLRGPEKPGWFEALKAAGASPVGGPLSHYNIIARLDYGRLGDVARLPFVKWLGRLEPAYKLPFPLPSFGDVKFDMVFFKEARDDFETGLGMVRAYGGTVIELDSGTDWWNSAVVMAPAPVAHHMLELPGLWTLEVAGQAGPRNDVARWVLQSFDAETLATPYWDAGLTGSGVIVGLADSGIDYDHIAFRNGMDDQGTPGPTHRKIVRYNTSIDSWDNNGHGTHVAGSLAGDSLITPNGYDKYDGLAYDAKIAFYDIVEADGATWSPPLIRDILGDAYDAGARSHSDSWGDSNTQYTLRAQRIDQFQWDHPDFLTFVAAGNKGPGAGTVEEPATAKNIVAVGVAINGNTTDLNQISAHGPTQQGLIAPTLVAPGTSVMSASSDGQPNTFNSGYRPMTGTSMATPLAAASGALVEQYFRDGFFPNGSRGSGPGFLPSGPMRKAVLVASAWDQAGGKNVEGNAPDFAQGWGKILLSNALYLAGNAKTPRLWVEDYYNDSRLNEGLSTGMTRTVQIAVNSSLPLKIVLAWNDWPGAGLVNDLNLVITAPDGKVFRGNQFLNGSSVASNKADINNTVEAVILQHPVRGVYTINVTALRVGSGGSQRYAIAARGDLYDPVVALLYLDRERTAADSTVGVTLRDSGLRGTGRVTVNAASATETAPEQFTLLETGTGGLFTGAITLHLGNAAHDGMVEVQDGDRVRVSYNDADPPGIAWDDVLVDGSPPRILNWTLENVTDTSAFIRVETDEPSAASVAYWSAMSSAERSDGAMTSVHGMVIDGLSPRTAYSADIVVEDDCGNGQNFNLSGRHLNFRTHDMAFRPLAGFAGYAIDSGGGNHFGEISMSAGLSDSVRRLAGVRFDAPGYPARTNVTWAQLRLMVKNTDPALTTTTWTVEMLAANASYVIDPSRSEPIYPLLLDGASEGALGNAFAISEMVPGRWQLFNLTTAQCAALYRGLAEGRAAFRVKALTVTQDDSYVEWYTGASPKTSFWAPQLVVDIDYPPEVVPGAILAFQMDEDTVDISHVNMTRIFSDPDGDALKYDARVDPDGPVSNMTVRIEPGGDVSFRPRQDWNGPQTVRLTAQDPYGLTAVHFVNVTVEPVNDPVRITTINGTPAVEEMRFSVLQDEPTVLNVGVEDPDVGMEGDSFRYSTNDSLVRFVSSKNGTISFWPGNDDVGVRSVRVTVRDRESEYVINITVDVVNINDPPEAYLESPLAGEPYDNQTMVWFSAFGSSDPDEKWGDILNFSWESNQTGIVGYGMDMNATLTPGNHTIVLTVMDLAGAYCQTSVEITVDAVEPPIQPQPNHTRPAPAPTRTGEIYYRLVAVALIILSLILCWLLVVPRRPANPPPHPAGDTEDVNDEADGPVVDVEADEGS